ncbi:MAG: 50S ribosomal protein L5 [Candidatus Sumerlaeia bacterium]
MAGNGKTPQPAYTPNLKARYDSAIVEALQEKFQYRNRMQVPRLVKIVVNMGIGDAARDAKALEAAMNDLSQITGQKPRLNRCRKSIAAFKVREGMPVGCSVTLRGRRMYSFLERLINAAIPRIRDFRGLPVNSFDGRGNYNMGIKEHTIFLELDMNKVQTVHGMDIAFVTTAKTDQECRELLALFGLPFRR